MSDVAKETGVLTNDSNGHVRSIKDQWSDFCDYFNFKTSENRSHVRALCGTALTWFFLYVIFHWAGLKADQEHSDIATYGVSLNNANILQGIGFGTGKTKGDTLYNTAVGGLIVSVFVRIDQIR